MQRCTPWRCSAAGVPAASERLRQRSRQRGRRTSGSILLTALERPSPRAGPGGGPRLVRGLTARRRSPRSTTTAWATLVDRLRQWAQSLVGGGLSGVAGRRPVGRPAGAGARPARWRTRPHRPRPRGRAPAERHRWPAGGRVGAARRPRRPGRPAGSSTGRRVVAPELLVRRIDRDDDTVKVLTVHKAKGLEFPVVLCPTLWTQRGPSLQGLPHASIDGVAPHRHRQDGRKGQARQRARSGRSEPPTPRSASGRTAACSTSALTRAKHRLVVWWSAPLRQPAPCGDLSPRRRRRPEAARRRWPAAPRWPHRPRRRPGSRDPAPWTGAPDSHRSAPSCRSPRARGCSIARWRIWSFSAVKAAAEAPSPCATASRPSPPTHRRWGAPTRPSVRRGRRAPRAGGRRCPPSSPPPASRCSRRPVAPGSAPSCTR